MDRAPDLTYAPFHLAEDAYIEGNREFHIRTHNCVIIYKDITKVVKPDALYYEEGDREERKQVYDILERKVHDYYGISLGNGPCRAPIRKIAIDDNRGMLFIWLTFDADRPEIRLPSNATIEKAKEAAKKKGVEYKGGKKRPNGIWKEFWLNGVCPDTIKVFPDGPREVTVSEYKYQFFMIDTDRNTDWGLARLRDKALQEPSEQAAHAKYPDSPHIVRAAWEDKRAQEAEEARNVKPEFLLPDDPNTWQPWQKKWYRWIIGESDMGIGYIDRKVYIGYDKDGCAGKSTFCKTIAYLFYPDVCYLPLTKGEEVNNIAALLAKALKDGWTGKILLLDLPKGVKVTDAMLIIIEGLKAGMILDEKYKSRPVPVRNLFAGVFTNNTTNRRMLTIDRCHIDPIIGTLPKPVAVPYSMLVPDTTDMEPRDSREVPRWQYDHISKRRYVLPEDLSLEDLEDVPLIIFEYESESYLPPLDVQARYAPTYTKKEFTYDTNGNEKVTKVHEWPCEFRVIPPKYIEKPTKLTVDNKIASIPMKLGRVPAKTDLSKVSPTIPAQAPEIASLDLFLTKNGIKAPAPSSIKEPTGSLVKKSVKVGSPTELRTPAKTPQQLEEMEKMVRERKYKLREEQRIAEEARLLAEEKARQLEENERLLETLQEELDQEKEQVKAVIIDPSEPLYDDPLSSEEVAEQARMNMELANNPRKKIPGGKVSAVPSEVYLTGTSAKKFQDLNGNS